MMKRMIHTAIGPWLKGLIVWALLLSFAAIPAVAEVTAADLTLTPEPLTYEDGNIVLSKQAERIGPDEWRVNVQATVKETPVETPEIEVVFVLDVSSTMNACAVMDQHNSYFNGGGSYHTHTENCPDDCTAIYHVHVSGSPSSNCYKIGGANGTVYYPTRISVAKEAINTFVDNLPTGTSCKYVTFSTNATVVSNYDALGQYDIQGQTYIMKGVDLGTTQFSNDVNKTHVLVLVTDGMATDNAYSSDAFTAFTTNGGVVFTVGFNHTDPNLEGMVANGGAYYQASNPGELTDAFTDIGAKLTAMIEDPMGKVVGFDTVTKDNIIAGGGTITTVGDTIYWSPSEGTDNSEGLTGTIAYHYTVKLNDDANTDEGMHGTTVEDPVPLNNPTWFHYGTAEEMKKELFPIPYAAYGVSSVQTKWQYNGTNLLDPTEVEKEVGCDYKGDITNDDGTVTAYVPAFEQEYDVLTPTIQKDGVTYIYDSTTVTVTKPDGAVETYTYTNPADVDTVIASNPDAHVVVHNYLKAGQLVIDGTKVLEGREFEAGDAFTFKLTATNGAPLPSPSTVTITPTAGSSESFRFPPITFNATGTYTYTLQELLPEESARLERMDYDTEPRTVVVMVTRNSSGVLNASYTVDGQTLPAVFTNRYALGNLLISKTVGGNMGSRNSEFDFTVTLPDMAGQTVSCTLDGSPLPLTLDDQGQATFTLRHDQTLVMSAVHGAYTVEEARFGSYVTNISVNDGDSVQTNSVSGTLGAGDTHAAFLNTLNAEVPTGIATSTGAAIAGLMLSTALLAISHSGRRRRDVQ